ncbi:MAG: acetoin utilization protein AcuC [Pseudomonadota bacterium]
MQHIRVGVDANEVEQALFISSSLYRESGFSGLHPLAISRISAVETICRALGWIDHKNYRECAPADIETLSKFHSRDYLENLLRADKAGVASIAERETYNFGTMENPLFKGVFSRAATTVGGSILGADLSLANGVSFHPGGGTHHGKKNRASGFCYFNDPVFAILRYFERGLRRVAYVDFDAHHGDGVEEAFSGEPDIRLVSIHEENRWPHTGRALEDSPPNAMNLPAPAQFNDSELAFLLNECVLPYLDRFSPEAIVITCGADALADDPLSGLQLSNRALWDAVEAVVAMAPHSLVLGGGGYNPWTTARAWAGLWGRLDRHDAPQRLPQSVRDLFQTFECDLVDEDDFNPRWMESLEDDVNEGHVRQSVKAVAHAQSRLMEDFA